jgi:hypothetical protein
MDLRGLLEFGVAADFILEAPGRSPVFCGVPMETFSGRGLSFSRRMSVTYFAVMAGANVSA